MSTKLCLDTESCYNCAGCDSLLAEVLRQLPTYHYVCGQCGEQVKSFCRNYHLACRACGGKMEGAG